MNDIDKRLKRGDIVQDLETGELHELADFQYEFNRYQFKWISGWKYGIKNIKKVESGEILDYVKYLSSERKAEREEKERYEKALKEITKLGWSSSFGGGYNYMGEHHAKCIEIARSALGGDRE